MNRALAGLLGLALLLGGAPAARAGEDVTVGDDVGQLHPDYAFPALKDDTLVRLSSFRGTKVLLVQFASW